MTFRVNVRKDNTDNETTPSRSNPWRGGFVGMMLSYLIVLS